MKKELGLRAGAVVTWQGLVLEARVSSGKIARGQFVCWRRAVWGNEPKGTAKFEVRGCSATAGRPTCCLFRVIPTSTSAVANCETKQEKPSCSPKSRPLFQVLHK